MYIIKWIAERKTRTKVLMGLLAAVIVLVLVASQFMAVALPSAEAHSVFSAVFDVPQMRSVNKITIRTPNGLTTITERSLIKKVVKETTVSNSMGGFRCFFWGSNAQPHLDREGNEICLYKDDTLIRRMPQSIGVDGCWGDSEYARFRAVILYQKDDLHYVSHGEQAWGYLSIGLLEQLEAEMQRQGNSYFTE